MDIKGKKYIVTGGAGFIGSHLVDLLVAEGAYVTILDNLSTGRMENVNKAANFIEVDLLDKEAYKKELIGTNEVFHFAALPRIQPSFDKPIEHENSNVLATLFLLEAMTEMNIKSITFSSSSSVYGDPTEIPTSESCQIDPLNPYAMQKYASERYCIMFAERYGFRANALRYFNAYGPRSYNASNSLSAYSSVVGIFNAKKINNEILQVTGDGKQTRDFVHVFDIARANLQLHLSQNNGEVFNLGYGQDYSINEVASYFSDSWEFIPARQGEASITLANIDKLRNTLGWSPSIHLEDAIKENML